jgi:hypothetical protein
MTIYDLIHRGNINLYHYQDKHIVVYEDHRYLLNVLYALKLIGDLNHPFNLIYFDFHDDALKPGKHKVEMSKNFRKNPPGLAEFWQFVEFDLGSNDDDWLLTGMELGLINDAILIGSVENQNINDIVAGYKDHLNNKHHVYPISHLWHSLGDRGTIGDSVIKNKSYTEVRNILGFNTKDHYCQFTSDINRPFILDFDCDVFSTEILGETKAWPRERMFELFGTYIHGSQTSSRTFVKSLIQRSSIITICRESGCCGGIKESNAILSNIDDLLFDGAICK